MAPTDDSRIREETEEERESSTQMISYVIDDDISSGEQAEAEEMVDQIKQYRMSQPSLSYADPEVSVID